MRRRRSEDDRGPANEVPSGRELAFAVAVGLLWRGLVAVLRSVGRAVLASTRRVAALIGLLVAGRAERPREEGPAEAPVALAARQRVARRRRLRRRLALAGGLALAVGAAATTWWIRADGGPSGEIPGLAIPVTGVAAEDLLRSFDAPRSGGRRHRAIDIPAPRGTAAVAAADGVILRTSLGGLAGLSVCLRTEEGDLDFFYAHLEELTPGTVAGRRVRRGDLLGTVGATGNARGGTPHLHFQVTRAGSGARCGGGEALDPYDLLVESVGR